MQRIARLALALLTAFAVAPAVCAQDLIGLPETSADCGQDVAVVAFANETLDGSSESSGQDGCACDTCNCPATWRVRSGALFLDRSDPPSRPLIVEQQGFLNFVPVVNTNDFTSATEAGWEISVARRLGCRWDVEARYFDISDWSDTIAGQTPGPPPTGGFGFLYNNGTQRFGVFNPSTLFTFSTSYRSELKSVEVLGRYLLHPCVQVSAGFRYVNFHDQLTGDFINFVGATPNATNSQRIAARNNLYGLQIGAEAMLWRRGRLSLEGIGKIGLYGNDASNRITTTSISGSTNSGLSRTQASFVGELELAAAYRLTPRWSIRGGYRVLLLDQVAFATEQLNANARPVSPLSPVTVVDANDQAIYHGASAMLEFTW